MAIGYARPVWQYRAFIRTAITNELRGRFARSKIGGLWFLLNPLATAAIYALVLSKLLGARLGGVDDPAAYPVYLIAGLAGWTLFFEITNRCLTIFMEYAGALKKIAFPRIALPIIVLGNALVNQAFLLVAVGLIATLLGYPVGLAWIALPLLTAVAAMLGFGLGILLGLMNVFVRDVGQVVAVVLQLAFWLTPIVYPLSILPEQVAQVVQANPVTPIVQGYQDIVVFERFPDLSSLLVPVLVGGALLLASVFVFRRAAPELVDAL